MTFASLWAGMMTDMLGALLCIDVVEGWLGATARGAALSGDAGPRFHPRCIPSVHPSLMQMKPSRQP